MIVGSVIAAREAIVSLTVRGLDGRREDVQAVVDTGFTGELTLPPRLVTRLALRWDHAEHGILADGSETDLDVYEATALWDGSPRVVTVGAIEGVPLIGMTLLDGYELRVVVRSGGTVTIRSLNDGESGA
jgi:clan AA aspartic protease